MKEPRRLVKSDAPGADLLSAGRAYRLPAASRRRLQRMLGLPVVLSLGATLSAALASTSAKALLVAAAVTATTAGAAVAYRAAVRNPAAPVQRNAELRSVRAPVAPFDSIPTGTGGPGVATDPAPTRLPHRRLTIPPARGRAAIAPSASSPAAPRIALPPQTQPADAPPAAVASPSPPSIAAELALLDAAERAIRRDRPAEALARLQEHQRAFPDSALPEEAAVLHIAALFAANHRTEARARAERFLSRSGGSLLADRVRSMLAADSEKAASGTAKQGDHP
jgi:hypothetical protein